MEIWAHRGVSAIFPENTMLAFEEAWKCGADAIELDVQRTRDGELIVIHDETLNRTTNGRGYVYASSYSLIKTLDAGGKLHPRFRGEKIPTLRDVLDFIRSTDMRLNIEIKNEQVNYAGIEAQVIRAIEQFQLAERVVISSFNHHAVQTVKKVAPHIETALLTGAFTQYSSGYASQLGMNAIHPEKRTVNVNYMKEAMRYQIKVRPYTVNEPYLIRVFHAIGVDAIVTDHPQMARKFINTKERS